MTEKHKKIAGICAIIFFIGFMVIAFWFAGRPMLQLVNDPDLYRNQIQDKGLLAQLSFIAMVFFQVIVSIIPGEPLEICAGYAFGALEGTVLCLIGTALGGAAVFMLVRTLGVKLVEVFFSVEKIRSMKFLRDSKKRSTIAFVVMLLPGTPKDLICYFAGLTDIKVSEWLILSTIARIPSIVTSTVGGNALAEQKYLFALIVFAITVTISLVGLAIYRKISTYREEKKAEKQASQDDPQ